ncbi:hypothetical protein BB561_005438 [Smittium simulii]|uniref:Uncharacterized protein n=1 Tax=Smittium simulii TaxID=133385 RepID=A0A2T9YAC5_9FUNG|nr:hypothetical protein BB561_005438 [Smittium simulii]
MLFHKSTLFSCVLAQALIQKSVFADESKVQLQKNTDCLIPGRKCSAGKNGYDQCVDGKSKFVECKSDQKCIIVNDYFSSCVSRDAKQECKKDYDECIDGLNGHAFCYNGKLSFLKCNTNQKCHVVSSGIPFCVNTDRLGCEKGYRKCVDGKNGYDHCYNGMLLFNECSADKICTAINGNPPECTKIRPECGENYSKCIDGKNGYENCVDGKLSFVECTADQKCVPFGTKASCIIDEKCDETISTCNKEQTGFKECVNKEYVFRKCSDTEQCVADGKFASCKPKNPGPVCDQGSGKCVPNQNGYQECVNNDYVFRQCKDTEKCVDLRPFVATCQPKNPGLVCDQGTDTEKCVNNGFFASCKPKISDPVCDESIATCNDERTGFDECVDSELIFTECTAEQKCVPFGTKASCVRGD